MKKTLFAVFTAALALLIASTLIASVHAEPALETVLDHLGFKDRSLITAKDVTFPPGTYKITLYAEFAGYNQGNELYYYIPGTPTTFYLIFTGPEGNFEYLTTPISKTFTITSTFGLSLNVTDQGHRYYTQNSLNLDGQNHSKVFQNLGDPTMLLVGMENLWGAGDRDYQDMVVSIQKLPNFVVPEVPIGTLAITAMLIALAAYVGFKRFRKQSPFNGSLRQLP